ncbi:hypothetical protein MP228_004070 [Amoeboaphelidium protococcarum]|nr:hypothetical protein MP228_004070 [Amoeboaphelidium protococcarum]
MLRSAVKLRSDRLQFTARQISYSKIVRNNNGSNDGEYTHFGNRTVKSEEKEHLVKEVFDNVADKYDLMNDVMSLAIHRLWKDRLMQVLSPSYDTKLLDVAGGTGDIAFRFLDAARQMSNHSNIDGYSAHVTVCDINQSMLDVGQRRAVQRGYKQAEMDWVCGNAEQLPFDDNSFDAYTIAFGIRNVTNIDKALSEAYRVLKPNGRLLVLEFSHVNDPIMSTAYDQFSKLIPVMGQAIANDYSSYQYLVESIRKFPHQSVFAQMIRDAGFQGVEWEELTFGVASIHSGWKLQGDQGSGDSKFSQS